MRSHSTLCADPQCPNADRVEALEHEITKLKAEMKAAFERVAVVEEKEPEPEPQPLIGPLHRSRLLGSLHYAVEGSNGRRVPMCGVTKGYMTSTKERVGCVECSKIMLTW